jgi:hypothetical protein
MHSKVPFESALMRLSHWSNELDTGCQPYRVGTRRRPNAGGGRGQELSLVQSRSANVEVVINLV